MYRNCRPVVQCWVLHALMLFVICDFVFYHWSVFVCRCYWYKMSSGLVNAEEVSLRYILVVCCHVKTSSWQGRSWGSRFQGSGLGTNLAQRCRAPEPPWGLSAKPQKQNFHFSSTKRGKAVFRIYPVHIHALIFSVCVIHFTKNSVGPTLVSCVTNITSPCTRVTTHKIFTAFLTGFARESHGHAGP